MDESGEIIEESEEIITDAGQEGITLKNVLSMIYLFFSRKYSNNYIKRNLFKRKK